MAWNSSVWYAICGVIAVQSKRPTTDSTIKCNVTVGKEPAGRKQQTTGGDEAKKNKIRFKLSAKMRSAKRDY
ncbi:unnamed protein product [Ceratitis capitata]|uniref:(Mediterranean fruit fly) hypothetical protein n=1 Tax=Ceratitis capitata TaxID=7213 RepID=A0A811VJ94_CERCA|nr:unnamed protein product [Ceratitis capitata]